MLHSDSIREKLGKMNFENYADWSFKIQCLLNFNGLAEHLNSPQDRQDESTQWTEDDDLIVKLILDTLDDGLKPFVQSARTAAEHWAILKVACEHRKDIHQLLQTVESCELDLTNCETVKNSIKNFRTSCQLIASTKIGIGDSKYMAIKLANKAPEAIRNEIIKNKILDVDTITNLIAAIAGNLEAPSLDEQKAKSDEQAPQLKEQAPPLDEKTARSDEQMLQSNEKTARSDEQAPQLDEKTARSDEQMLQSNEKTARSDEQIPQSNEKTAQSDEQMPQLDEKTARSDEQIPQSNEKTARSDEQMPQLDEPKQPDDDELNEPANYRDIAFIIDSSKSIDSSVNRENIIQDIRFMKPEDLEASMQAPSAVQHVTREAAPKKRHSSQRSPYRRKNKSRTASLDRTDDDFSVDSKEADRRKAPFKPYSTIDYADIELFKRLQTFDCYEKCSAALIADMTRPKTENSN